MSALYWTKKPCVQRTSGEEADEATDEEREVGQSDLAAMKR